MGEATGRPTRHPQLLHARSLRTSRSGQVSWLPGQRLGLRPSPVFVRVAAPRQAPSETGSPATVAGPRRLSTCFPFTPRRWGHPEPGGHCAARPGGCQTGGVPVRRSHGRSLPSSPRRPVRVKHAARRADVQQASGASDRSDAPAERARPGQGAVAQPEGTPFPGIGGGSGHPTCPDRGRGPRRPGSWRRASPGRAPRPSCRCRRPERGRFRLALPRRLSTRPWWETRSPRPPREKSSEAARWLLGLRGPLRLGPS